MYNNKLLENILNLGRAIIPRRLFNYFQPYYHWLLAFVASYYYGNPSDKIIIIGITGTKGKSTTANFVWAGLMATDLKTGLISTANIRIGNDESMNVYHMTMPSPFILQKKISEMVNRQCKVAIIEVTSEGIKQYRHIGISFDMLIFTNLTPEHIDAHGSFENYRETKQIIFNSLNKLVKKTIDKKIIPKTIIVNGDSNEFSNFLKYDSDVKIIFGIYNHKADINKSQFNLNLKIPGEFNIYNALPAIAVAKVLDLDISKVENGINNLEKIPGRMEIIQSNPFTVIVDYAHEKVSLTELLSYSNKKVDKGKIILLIGAEGGGRDKVKRGIMGEIGAKEADYLIISNVDPYDEKPENIINDIANGAKSNGKKIDQNLFLIENRKEGIIKAISLAGPGDIVLITGKGSEQSMIISGKKIDWDDRLVVSEILNTYRLHEK